MLAAGACPSDAQGSFSCCSKKGTHFFTALCERVQSSSNKTEAATASEENSKGTVRGLHVLDKSVPLTVVPGWLRCWQERAQVMGREASAAAASKEQACSSSDSQNRLQRA
mmetsp:Transcript_102698/g.203910  ORF Transcript_102698/g.203910 Transcript_102698/m.203910 type:complete len:111 (+) Transcript_102698:323-655(+)